MKMAETKLVDALYEALRELTPPKHGDFGGPLCSIVFIYEDGSEKSLGHEPATRARAALARARGEQ